MRKNKRDEDKLAGLQNRLDLIEKKLQITMDQCGKRERLAREQLERTNVFKEAVGLQTSEEEPKQKAKTWSELVEYSKNTQKKKENAAKEESIKHWSKKVHVKVRTKDKVTENKDIEKEDKDKALKINDSSSSHGEDD